MIPQPFVKGAGERVFFGPYEYPTGADLIFDFGNPICTSAFNTIRIVYNAATQNVTGSLIPYNNPGPIYPSLNSTNGGVMITNQFAFGDNYLEFDYSSSAEQTNITIFALNGGQLNPWSSFIPAASGDSSMQFNVYGNTVVTASATLDVTLYNTSNAASNIFSTTLNVALNNGRNGYNIISVSANSTNDHKLYINPTLLATDTTTINRDNQNNGVNRVGRLSKMKIMAYLQYPKVLTPKEIRQVNKVFSQRYFL
jgi:hypothetical protein